MKNVVVYEVCKNCGYKKGNHSAGALLCLIKPDRWSPEFSKYQVFVPDYSKPKTVPFQL